MQKIFMFVNVDWFFMSHRLPIAKAALRHNVAMTVYTDFTRTWRSDEHDGYSFYESPIPRSSLSVFHAVIEFFRTYLLIKNGKPDLIHAVTIKPILTLGLIARFTSTPFVGAVSGLGPAFQSNSWYKRRRLQLIIWLLSVIFRNANARIICQNEGDHNLLVKYGITPSVNVSLVPGSGVDVEVYSPTKKRYGLGDYVLMSSRILKDKGVSEFCFAAKMVREAIGDEVKFKLSGPIDNYSPTFMSESELLELVRHCGVEYLGNRDDMPELLASALLFVLPSYYAEGIPKVLLEAASSSVAIITTDHSGCRDAIIEGETGLLVPARDTEALASAMLQLLENRTLLGQMSDKGRQFAVSTFRDSVVVDHHYKIYQQLLQADRRLGFDTQY